MVAWRYEIFLLMLKIISTLEDKFRISARPCNILYLLYRHGCFTEKYTTRKIYKNDIRDPSGLFSIISHVSLSMISLISSLSLKLYLNSLVYHRNIFGSSSKVFGNLRQSSGIFGNFRKFSKNVRERSSGLRNNFGKSSEIFGRWSEIFRKSSKTASSACQRVNVKVELRLTFTFMRGFSYITSILIYARKGGFPLSRNFYVRTDINFNWLYVRKLK